MRSTKIRVLSAMMMAAFTASLFAGCGTKDETPAASTAASAAPAASATAAAPKAKSMKFLSIWAEDKDNSKLILDLTKDYQKTNPNFKLEFELVASENLRQKVKVLVASSDVPDVFVYESGKPLVELIDSGKILDVEKAFKDAGILDSLDAGAVSLLKKLVDGKGLYDIPLGMNVEGIWYNKKIFADNGLKVPGTWDELITVCKTLNSKGIQAFTAGGKDKWPLTRVVNMYVMRKLGADAMQRAVKGELSFTSPEFVEAAKAVQDMAKAGYFGKGVTTVDYGTAADMLCTGKAAMLYNGSWFVENLNSKEKNPSGPDGVGFMPMPLVSGGKGTLDDYSVNCGNILCLSKDKYDAGTAEWAKYVFTRLGDKAITDYGAFKGFKINNMPSNLPTYTKIVADELKKVKNAGLWFEASFDDKTTQLAQENVQALVLGAMTPEDYFAQIDKSVKAAKK